MRPSVPSIRETKRGKRSEDAVTSRIRMSSSPPASPVAGVTTRNWEEIRAGRRSDRPGLGPLRGPSYRRRWGGVARKTEGAVGRQKRLTRRRPLT